MSDLLPVVRPLVTVDEHTSIVSSANSIMVLESNDRHAVAGEEGRLTTILDTGTQGRLRRFGCSTGVCWLGSTVSGCRREMLMPRTLSLFLSLDVGVEC